MKRNDRDKDVNRERIKLARSFKNTFSSPDGKVVLACFKKKQRGIRIAMQTDPQTYMNSNAAVYKAALQDIIDWIEDALGADLVAVGASYIPEEDYQDDGTEPGYGNGPGVGYPTEREPD